MGPLFDALFPPRPRPYSAYAPIRTPRRSGARASTEPAVQTDAQRREEIERIAAQLARVASTVPWGRVQDDAWDRVSGFIYRLRSAARVRERALQVAAQYRLDPTEFVHYALRRWYCFWGARMTELLFLEHPGVLPGPPRHHEIDFTIDGVPFDLKTSEVPRLFLHSVDDLAVNPNKIATWLYEHQSRGGRFHTANRLFLLLCDRDHPGEAWRLRADVPALRAAIGQFMARRRFVDLIVPDRLGIEHPVRTAVIAVVPRSGPRQLALGLGGGWGSTRDRSLHTPAP